MVAESFFVCRSLDAILKDRTLAVAAAVRRIAALGASVAPLVARRPGDARDARAREICAQYFERVPARSEQSMTALIGAASDPEPDVRVAACGALAVAGHVGEKAVAALVACAHHYDTASWAACDALGVLQPPQSMAVEALEAVADEHADPVSRVYACQALGRIAGTSRAVVDRLLAHLEGEDSTTLTWTLEVLEEMDEPCGWPAVQERVRSPVRHPVATVGCAALACLCRAGMDAPQLLLEADALWRAHPGDPLVGGEVALCLHAGDMWTTSWAKRLVSSSARWAVRGRRALWSDLVDSASGRCALVEQIHSEDERRVAAAIGLAGDAPTPCRELILAMQRRLEVVGPSLRDPLVAALAHQKRLMD